MKKILSLLLALALLLSLMGCVPAELPQVTQPQPSQTTESTTAPTDPSGPTLPPQIDQTDPPETEPTLPPQIDQTDPPETEPSEPPATEPTAPPPTEPEVTEPAPTEPEPTEPAPTEPEPTEPVPYLDPDGSYTTKEDVALYIHLYGCLPNNFITKSEARKLGWKSGSLERYAPGKCIGGDRFYNREGVLPEGYTYYECDIGTLGSYSGRGAKRIVYSTDGRIYYTDDHYNTFTLLYPES